MFSITDINKNKLDQYDNADTLAIDAQIPSVLQYSLGHYYNNNAVASIDDQEISAPQNVLAPQYYCGGDKKQKLSQPHSHPMPKVA